MKRNLKTTLKTGILMALAIVAVVGLNSCKEDETTPKNTGGGGGGGGGTTVVDYILFDGYKLIMKNPAMGTFEDRGIDVTYNWAGNKPAAMDGDSILFISHESRKAQTYSKFTELLPEDSDEVGVIMQWGTAYGNPTVKINGGTYKLEKIDGKWVSTLKNGTGDWKNKKGELVKSYTGIEFRATWPE